MHFVRKSIQAVISEESENEKKTTTKKGRGRKSIVGARPRTDAKDKCGRKQCPPKLREKGSVIFVCAQGNLLIYNSRTSSFSLCLCNRYERITKNKVEREKRTRYMYNAVHNFFLCAKARLDEMPILTRIHFYLDESEL